MSLRAASSGALAAEPSDEAAITQRIIDCCLREDIRGLVSQGQVGALPAGVDAQGLGQPGSCWLRITHLGSDEWWLPVIKGNPLQAWASQGSAWLKRVNGQSAEVEHGYRRWLAHLSQGLDEESLALFRAYLAEADCATEHRALCNQARLEHQQALAQVLDLPQWSQRLIKIDQLASYLDHPLYPTARAKSGFDAAALQQYAPEFSPRFELNWLAVPNTTFTLTSPPPGIWPSFADLGLPPGLQHSHCLVPVHPLTWQALDRYGLPEGTVKAPRAALWVEPTLSVRTVVCLHRPQWHIKLPLLVCTLGARNLRLIKPSTLYDGYWFQTTLQALAARDTALGQRYLHVDEQHGGHADDSRHLAYITRRYPAGLENATLVPVAALASPLADGRLFLEQLAERFHAGSLDHWLETYLDLLLQVHLRLWLRYGIALEANQQNAVLMYQQGRAPRLLMKDNDAARLWPLRFAQACPDLADSPARLRDERICVDGTRPLAEMFCTITLQLNIVAILEAMITAGTGQPAAPVWLPTPAAHGLPHAA